MNNGVSVSNARTFIVSQHLSRFRTIVLYLLIFDLMKKEEEYLRFNSCEFGILTRALSTLLSPCVIYNSLIWLRNSGNRSWFGSRTVEFTVKTR